MRVERDAAYDGSHFYFFARMIEEEQDARRTERVGKEVKRLGWRIGLRDVVILVNEKSHDPFCPMQVLGGHLPLATLFIFNG